MTELTVELYGFEVGRLTGSGGRAFDFGATEKTFERFQVGSNILSEASTCYQSEVQSGEPVKPDLISTSISSQDGPEKPGGEKESSSALLRDVNEVQPANSISESSSQ